MNTLCEFTSHLRSLTNYSQNDFMEFHQTLKARYEQLFMDALMERHPGWSVVSGETAFLMFLYRNWIFSKKSDENTRQINELTMELEMNYTDADGFVSAKDLESAMFTAERVYGLSDGILKDRHVLILQLPASHKREDSFCRCYETESGAAVADIYMLVPQKDHTATPESILLHEVGHVVTLALTGSVDLLPNDISMLTALLGLEVDESDQREFFAHCFAMSLLIEPELQSADPFTNVPLEHKQVYQGYFSMKLCPAA